MFEDVAVDDLLGQVRAHDFDADPARDFGANRIDAIAALDRVIRAAQAAQATQIGGLFAERCRSVSLTTAGAGLSVVGEVAMARNISPSAAGTQLALALSMEALADVAALFAAGTISEPVVRAVSRESANLDVDLQVVLEGVIAPALVGLTAAKAAALTRHHVVALDADAALARAEAARADSWVSMFPEPDGVAVLQVRGPAEQIVAAHGALDAWARGLRSAGDGRTTGQIMCQTLVERVTGVARADHLSVEIALVMDARTLLADGTAPVELTGYGPLSPDVGDDILARAHQISVRRLLTDPVDGTLLARDPRRRRYDGPMPAHIRARDKRCRQPGCDAAIRDNDHIHEFADGGPTTISNAQGLCKRSHTIKSLPGWKVIPDGKATLWTTPTGHTYRSPPPRVLPRTNPGHLRQ